MTPRGDGHALTAVDASTLWTGLLSLAVALLAVLSPAWRVLRHVLTIAHEGGHATVAALSGRRLRGVRLHSDTSGLTVSAGRASGFGLVMTLLAGYPAPSLLGLLGAWAIAQGYATALLGVCVALLVVLLLQVRNLFGVLSVTLVAAALTAAAWLASPRWQEAVAAVLIWVLLLGGPRTVVDLQRSRRRSRSRGSDADQLARLTHVPGVVWVLVFLAVSVGCLVLGGIWLVIGVGSTIGG